MLLCCHMYTIMCLYRIKRMVANKIKICAFILYLVQVIRWQV